MYCEVAKKYSFRVAAHKDMDIVLRDCDANDEIALERLFLQLGYKISKEEIQEKLITLSGIPGSYQILAQIHSQIVGFIGLQISHWAHLVNPVARVTTLVIDSEWRGRGVGNKMICHVEKIATAAGCKIIEVTSATRRAEMGTHSFYHQLGYKNASDQTIYFRKKLVS